MDVNGVLIGIRVLIFGGIDRGCVGGSRMVMKKEGRVYWGRMVKE